MANPRLMAEDVAHHYMEKISAEFPHSQNINRHLRTPLFAVTRRILLPHYSYPKLELEEEVGTFGGDYHADPSLNKRKEGLDWRDYVSSASLSTDTKSETEISDSEDNQRIYQYYKNRQPQGEGKLSRRTVARMEAFLSSCAIALSDKELISHTRTTQKERVKAASKSPVINSLQSFASNFAPTKQRSSKNVQITRKSYPQMNLNDLTMRLELYIRSLRRIHSMREQQSKQRNEVDSEDRFNEPIECIVHYESPRAIAARVQILIDSLINKTNSVGSMRPILTKLLKYLTRELLAVEHLSEDLTNHITKIALEYEHLTSFASLAFLSSPENSAETNLAPLLYNYVEYLRNEWEMCVDKCKLETGLCRAIDKGMRHIFKSSEFQSIGHLLEVCKGYKDQLEHIEISSRDYIPAEKNALRSSDTSSIPDVISSAASGDEIDVKKCNVKTTKAIKQGLRDLRREIITVNGHLLPPARTLTELVKLLRERLHSRTVKLKDKRLKTNSNRNDTRIDNTPNVIDQPDSDTSTSKSSEDIVDESSGNEADIDGIGKRLSKTNSRIIENENSNAKSKRRHFNVEAIDIMTRRLLIAASRTRIGGDAYFIVRDLFGGEGVEVIPSSISPMSPYTHGKISPTIEISVRLASIMIKCHSTFNVFPEPYTGTNEPLIQLRTTTTETIDLQTVRVGADGNELNDRDYYVENGNRKSTKLMLKEKKTENSGRKILSIRPAKYERIENWQTVS